MEGIDIKTRHSLPPIAPPCLFLSNISLIILSFPPTTGVTAGAAAGTVVSTAAAATTTAATGTTAAVAAVEIVGNRIEVAGIGIEISITGATLVASPASTVTAVTADWTPSGTASAGVTWLVATGCKTVSVGAESWVGAIIAVSAAPVTATATAPPLVAVADATGVEASDALAASD